MVGRSIPRGLGPSVRLVAHVTCAPRLGSRVILHLSPHRPTSAAFRRPVAGSRRRGPLRDPYRDGMTFSSDVEIADAGIRQLISHYFDVMHFQNMELFDRVFHRDCVLYSAQGGELSIRPYPIYREQVANRESPATLGNVRDDRVLDSDQVSSTLAWVKPQLQMFGGVMQDYLNLVFLDGQWWVMAKMWERVGDAA